MGREERFILCLVLLLDVRQNLALGAFSKYCEIAIIHRASGAYQLIASDLTISLSPKTAPNLKTC